MKKKLKRWFKNSHYVTPNYRVWGWEKKYSIMKNLEKRNGFKNRHIDGLPTKKVIMKVVTNDGVMLCQWKPFNKEEYSIENMPANRYLGTAKHNGIAFHAWEKNNSEFVYYSVVN